MGSAIPTQKLQLRGRPPPGRCWRMGGRKRSRLVTSESTCFDSGNGGVKNLSHFRVWGSLRGKGVASSESQIPVDQLNDLIILHLPPINLDAVTRVITTRSSIRNLPLLHPGSKGGRREQGCSVLFSPALLTLCSLDINSLSLTKFQLL